MAAGRPSDVDKWNELHLTPEQCFLAALFRGCFSDAEQGDTDARALIRDFFGAYLSDLREHGCISW